MKQIEVEGLRKVYHIGKLSNEVLKGISFWIEAGEFVSIVGPSGCGKSTLLYVLGGLESYQKGSVKLFEQELSSYTDHQKAILRSRDIGFVFQFYNLIPNLTVYENILLASVLGEVQSKASIIEVLKQVNMEEYQSYYPNQLSGGMQQRVAIARALINHPKIIFADEPIGNLDYENGQSIMELFSRLNKELHKTIVMVTHNADTTRYGTRILKMLDGRVASDEKDMG